MEKLSLKTTKGVIILKKIFLSKGLKSATIFLIGWCGYYLIELAFRGYSHWTMGLCGGICFLQMYFINCRYQHFPLIFRALICTLFITFVEFIAGCLLNLWLGLEIWDYSELPYNVLGQISLTFSCLWFYLSLVLCILISLFNKLTSRKKF